MLARGIRTDGGSVASAMLTALLRSRLGFFGRVGFLDPLQLQVNYPPGGIAAIRAANVRERSAPGLQRGPLKTQTSVGWCVKCIRTITLALSHN